MVLYADKCYLLTLEFRDVQLNFLVMVLRIKISLSKKYWTSLFIKSKLSKVNLEVFTRKLIKNQMR